MPPAPPLCWMLRTSGILLLLATCSTLTPPLAYAAYDCDIFTVDRKCQNDMTEGKVDAVHSVIANEADCRAACEATVGDQGSVICCFWKSNGKHCKTNYAAMSTDPAGMVTMTSANCAYVVECSAGKYKRTSDNTCQNCPSGQYRDDASHKLTSCKTCAPGKFALSSIAGSSGAATTCGDCPSGKYQHLTAATTYACSACGPGKFALSSTAGSLSAAATCGDCVAGEFSASSTNAAYSCVVCLPGKFALSATAGSSSDASACGTCATSAGANILANNGNLGMSGFNTYGSGCVSFCDEVNNRINGGGVDTTANHDVNNGKTRDDASFTVKFCPTAAGVHDNADACRTAYVWLPESDTYQLCYWDQAGGKCHGTKNLQAKLPEYDVGGNDKVDSVCCGQTAPSAVCKTCRFKMFHHSGTCVAACPTTGFFSNNNGNDQDGWSCDACETNCATCDDAATCTACESGFTLESGDCSPPNPTCNSAVGYHLNPTCDVSVVAPTNLLLNIAPEVSSSKHEPRLGPNFLTDGVLTTGGDKKYWHSDPDDDSPQAKVTLAKTTTITEVRVTNRCDCCAGRLLGATVHIEQSPSFITISETCGCETGSGVTRNGFWEGTTSTEDCVSKCRAEPGCVAVDRRINGWCNWYKNICTNPSHGCGNWGHFRLTTGGEVACGSAFPSVGTCATHTVSCEVKDATAVILRGGAGANADKQSLNVMELQAFEDKPCSTATCQASECCDVNPTCDDIDGSGADFASSSCVAGTNHLKDTLVGVTCQISTCDTSDCCDPDEEVVVVVAPVTTEKQAEASINNLNAAAAGQKSEGSQDGSGEGITQEELERQYEQRKEVLRYLEESMSGGEGSSTGNMTMAELETKTELLEKVTSSMTSLDVGGAKLALNVSESILESMLVNVTGSGEGGEQRRRNITKKVGGVVSNVILALNFVGRDGGGGGGTSTITTSPEGSVGGGDDGSEEYTRAVEEVYTTIDLLSDVQLVGVPADSPPIKLTTPAFDLVSQRSSKVGKEILTFNASSSGEERDLSSIIVPTDLGVNFASGVTADMSMTTWAINLHANEVTTVRGPAVQVTLVGVSRETFEGGGNTIGLRANFVKSLQRGVDPRDPEGVTITILGLHLRHLSHLRRLQTGDEDVILDIDFAVHAPGQNDTSLLNSLNGHLASGALGSDLVSEGDDSAAIVASRSGKKSWMVSFSPSGQLTGFKIKQKGKEVKVVDSGWFMREQRWTGDDLEKRINQTILTSTYARGDNKRVNLTVAQCNATNVGATWDVSCSATYSSSSTTTTAATITATTRIKTTTIEPSRRSNVTTKSATNISADSIAMCPESYNVVWNMLLCISGMTFLTGMGQHLLWQCNDGGVKRHHYNDWVRLYLLSGLCSLISLAVVTHACRTGSSTVVGVHVALILSSIVSICLSMITASLLFYLVPKSYVGCFPYKNKGSLYAAQEKKRLAFTREQKNYLLSATPRTKKKRNSLRMASIANLHKLENVVDRVSHTKKHNTDFVSEEAGPMEIYARWHRNWPWLLVLLCCLLLPSSISTLKLLSDKGVSIVGTSEERAKDRPFLEEQERLEIEREERSSVPSFDILMSRVRYAKANNGNILICEVEDDYVLTMECPVEMPIVKEANADECVFWNTKTRLWSSDGCELVSSTPELTTCRCNHLTDFGTAMSDSVHVWERVFEEPDALQLFVVNWYALLSIGVLLATFAAITAYGHRYDVLLQRRSSMRGSLIALHVFSRMLKRHRERKRRSEASEERKEEKKEEQSEESKGEKKEAAILTALNLGKTPQQRGNKIVDPTVHSDVVVNVYSGATVQHSKRDSMDSTFGLHVNTSSNSRVGEEASSSTLARRQVAMDHFLGKEKTAASSLHATTSFLWGFRHLPSARNIIGENYEHAEALEEADDLEDVHVPSFGTMLLARLLHEHDILELCFVNDRWMTRVHRSVILLARLSIKVSVVGTFFIVKNSTEGFWDSVAAIFLGFVVNKIFGGFIKALFVILAKKRRQRVLAVYVGRRDRANHDKLSSVSTLEKRELNRHVMELQIEEKLDRDKHWMGTACADVCCCCCRGCGGGKQPTKSHGSSSSSCDAGALCLDVFGFFVWMTAFASISFCLFFGIMFSFALKNDELAGAWLASVIGSLVFWLFVSRPLTITIKTAIAKCKLERKASKKRKELDDRREQMTKTTARKSMFQRKVQELDVEQSSSGVKSIEMIALATDGNDGEERNSGVVEFVHFNTDIQAPEKERIAMVEVIQI